MNRMLAGLLIALFLFSSGCALLWLGAGGAGGYFIRKGEEDGGTTNRKGASESTASAGSRPSSY